MSKAFDKIRRGLEQALPYAPGDDPTVRLTHVAVVTTESADEAKFKIAPTDEPKP
jgi:hypothetical protein